MLDILFETLSINSVKDNNNNPISVERVTNSPGGEFRKPTIRFGIEESSYFGIG